MSVPAAESGLVVVVEEAADLVAAFRTELDSSAALAVPPHVTVLYPFVPPAEVDGALLDRLSGLFAGVGGFDASFGEVRWFGEQVLWLAPEPVGRFRRLTELVSDAFPDHPPYGGQFDEVVPHLTVADHGEPKVLRDAERRLADRLPVRTRVASVELLAQHDPGGPFTRLARFALD